MVLVDQRGALFPFICPVVLVDQRPPRAADRPPARRAAEASCFQNASIAADLRSTRRSKRKRKTPECGAFLQSGRRDLNPRPPAPKAGALPGCATPRDGPDHGRVGRGCRSNVRPAPATAARHRPSSIGGPVAAIAALPRPALRPGAHRRARGRRRAAVRRDRRAAARRAGRALAAQRRGDRPPAGRTAATRTRTPRRRSPAGSRTASLVRDREPALWALEQDYTGPDGRRRTRHGFFARVRVEDYGAGPDPPARAHAPGPEGGPAAADARDRARTSRRSSPSTTTATRLDGARAEHVDGAPLGDGHRRATAPRHRLWRVGDPRRDRRRHEALAPRRAADRRRPPPLRDRARLRRGDRRRGREPHVLMCLVSLRDPGLTIFPTHRLADRARRRPARGAAGGDRARLGHRGGDRRGARAAARRPGRADRLPRRELQRAAPAHAARTRRSPTRALPDRSEPYRRLDTAVLEALLLKGALGMTEDDISHLNGLDYARSTAEARERVLRGDVRRRLLHARHAGGAGARGRRRGRGHAAEVDLLLPEGPHRPACSIRSTIRAPPRTAGRCGHNHHDAMRARARQRENFRHDVKVREHHLIADEPRDIGRRRPRPEPAGAARRLAWPRAPRSRWRCTPSARAGTSAASRSTADYTPAERGCPTRFELVLTMPAHLSDEQVERLRSSPPSARCTGRSRARSRSTSGSSSCLSARARAGRRAARRPARSRARPPRIDVHGAHATPPCSSRSTSTRTAPARRLHPPPRRPAPPRRRDLVPRRPARRRATPTCATTALREAQEEVGLPARGGRAARRAAADADVRHQLRDLSVRRPDRARLRLGARRRARSHEVLELPLRRCAAATRGAGCAPRHARSARTPTSSATTSSGARRPGSSPTCSSACGRLSTAPR